MDNSQQNPDNPSAQSDNNLLNSSGKQGESKQLLNWKVDVLFAYATDFLSQTTIKKQDYLYDDNTQVDVIKFINWDRNLEMSNRVVLLNDLPRIRSYDDYFKKEKTRANLELIATFYCKSNGIDYQQGLLQIVAPFLLLRSSSFKLPKCYAYFNAFMTKFFPSILKPRSLQILGQPGNHLPHAECATQLCTILLKYHSHKIMDILEKINIGLNAIVLKWISTMFCQDTPMDFVYIILDQYLKKKNSNYIFYLAVALILQKEEKIIELFEGGEEDEVIMFCNKHIKDLKTEQHIYSLFKKADQIKESTPHSFEEFVKNINFADHSILSVEDVKTMLHFQLPKDMIPLFPEEALYRCLGINQNQQIQFTFLDCRSPDRIKELPFKNTLKYPLTNLISSKVDENSFKKEIKSILSKDLYQTKTHFAFIADPQEDSSMNPIVATAYDILQSEGIFHISLLSNAKSLEDQIIEWKRKRTNKQTKDILETNSNNSICAIY